MTEFDPRVLKAENPELYEKLVKVAKRKQPRDRMAKRVKPQYVTREEVEAMILYALDALFAEAERRTQPAPDARTVQ